MVQISQTQCVLSADQTVVGQCCVVANNKRAAESIYSQRSDNNKSEYLKLLTKVLAANVCVVPVGSRLREGEFIYKS